MLFRSPLILAELDPHSVYISAKDAAAATDDLKGSFSGVGVEFVIRDDTIHIQNVIQNGPAEKAGLLAGDKIVAVDGKPFVGKIVTNQEAMHRLKGPKDTKVKNEIARLTNLYKDIEKNRRLSTKGLIEEAAFMCATLAELKQSINENGPVDEMPQGEYSILREHPALKSYNSMVDRKSVV